MRPYRLAIVGMLALAGAEGPLAPAAAAEPPPTKIGAATSEHPARAGRTAALLVPVRYPLYMAGRRASVRVRWFGRHRDLRRASATVRLSAGVQRRPDRRRTFRFVHRVPFGKRAKAGRRVSVAASTRLDADGDGRLEVESTEVSSQRVRRRARARPACASVPVVRVRPGRTAKIKLPTCDRRVRWSVALRPRHGTVRRASGRILYRPARGHRGLDELLLRGRPADTGPARARAAAATAAGVAVRLYAGPPATAGLKVRALGDSVTAGFGYYADGSPMWFSSLFRCRPAASGYNDACSSNSLTTNSSSGGLSFAPDYGLSHNVSWAAQWANSHGITNYANVAVSGSAPGDWAPGGSLYRLTQGVEADDPDYVVLTLGANPLLSDVLFDLDTMGCALKSRIFGDFTQCVLKAFARVSLEQNLAAIYRELLTKTDATVLLMQYPLSIPATALAYSSVQVERMEDLLNATIASVAQSLASPRLRVVAPPRFNVGIDMTPLAPNNYSCSRFGLPVHVDGASVQATVTQDQLSVEHFSFCGPPGIGGLPWVISADTGIHPSAAGHAQMAGALPAP